MLIIEQITLTVSEPIFKSNSCKHIRFSYINHISNEIDSVSTRSKLQAQIITSQKIKWTQNISYPIIYNKFIDFQIFDQHKFGYNPEEFTQLMKGKFLINKGETFKDNIEAVTGDNHTVIGKLELKFRYNSIIPQKVQKIMPKNQKLIIKSIIAHLPQISKKKTYIAVKIGDIHKQTPIIKSHRGEVVFTDIMDIEKSSFIKEATFSIFMIEDRGNQVKSYAQGILELEGSFVDRKIDLKDQEGNKLGILFINARTMYPKSTKNRDTLSVDKIKFSTIDPSRLNRYQQTQAQTSRVSGISSLNTHNSMDQAISRLSSNNLLSLSRMSSSQYRTKKMTVLHENNQIVFPKQERFKVYQDKQSDYISYLEDRSELVMKEKHSGKFYRGASMGYGDKTDFVHKGSPGIGRYKLPSIWDRY